MKKFSQVRGRAYRLPQQNIDTDVIIAAQHLKTILRTGLGAFAFEKLRIHPDNVFDDVRYAASPILVAGANFGCGSSREHAVWAMADMGIRVVIAPSFGDIFAANAMKNGFLTVVLPQEPLDVLLELAPEDEITVDLPAQCVTTSAGQSFAFVIDRFQKNCLIDGLDHIDLTLQMQDRIAVYEARRLEQTPWLAEARKSRNAHG